MDKIGIYLLGAWFAFGFALNKKWFFIFVNVDLRHLEQ